MEKKPTKTLDQALEDAKKASDKEANDKFWIALVFFVGAGFLLGLVAS